LKAALSTGLIVMLLVAVTTGHPPDEAMVLVTVYVPGVLAARLTAPVEELIDNPAVELNVPATPPPENTGEGFAAVAQYGEPV
jgi:hypothetical protein